MSLSSSFKPSQSLLFEILEHSPEAVAVLNGNGLVIYANPSLAELLGVPVAEILDQPLPLSLPPESAQQIEILPRKLDRSSNNRPRLAAGRSRPARADAGLKIVYFRDLSDHQELKQGLRALTLKDELTHLYNFRTFMRFAEHQRELASRMKKPMVLVRIRLEGLADIEARLGVKMVESALIDFAELLAGTFRNSDLLARLGRDEFAVLAINAPGIFQEVITVRLRDGLTAFSRREKRPYTLATTIRTTWFDPEQQQTVAQLLERTRLDP